MQRMTEQATVRVRADFVAGIQQYLTGAISASSNPVANTHPWTFYYKAIKNANVFIANVDSSPLENSEKTSSKNQARFLRAYFYHELFRWIRSVGYYYRRDRSVCF